MTSTRCPACRWPTSIRPCNAVTPEDGMAAACANVSPAGLAASVSARATAYDAQLPLPVPNTSSPTWNRVTAGPTSTTTPARSVPMTAVLGARRP